MSLSDPSVEAIYVAVKHSSSTISILHAKTIAGQGIEGDRNFVVPAHSAPDQEITLIEAEAIEKVQTEFGLEFTASECRRNLVTRGIGLNDLVGKTFRVGKTVLKGQRLCHPCSHLQALTRPGILKALKNRGGLRATVISGGVISVGDLIVTELENASESSHA